MVSRVALLYAKYLGVNGSLFEVKVLGLQFMTIVLQVQPFHSTALSPTRCAGLNATLTVIAHFLQTLHIPS